MAQVIVIGAGAMGLAAAYHAIKAGHSVELLEAAPEIGGMAAHFDFGELSVERFYHFMCKTDYSTFELMRELGLSGKIRWRRTTMGQFTKGRLYPWGDPVALLRFPEISLFSRFRYGLFAFVSIRRNRWDAIENETARSWITRWCGPEVYEKLWRPLLERKFFHHADNISALWIWTRIRRLGRSRRSIFEEELGYIEGGSQTLVEALGAKIQGLGGKIRVTSPALKIVTEDNRVKSVETPEGILNAEAIICTVPTPLVSKIAPDLPPDWKTRYDAIENIGVCCLVFKLRRSVTPHFWVNVSEPDISIPGFAEFSNLRPIGEVIVYVPYYMPLDHPKFRWSDQQLIQEAFSCLQRVNPALGTDDILDAHVARLRYAQPICPPGFASQISPIQTPVAGLQTADTCYYYPEDRGISESVRLGRDMANRIDDSLNPRLC